MIETTKSKCNNENKEFSRNNKSCFINTHTRIHSLE